MPVAPRHYSSVEDATLFAGTIAGMLDSLGNGAELIERMRVPHGRALSGARPSRYQYSPAAACWAHGLDRSDQGNDS